MATLVEENKHEEVSFWYPEMDEEDTKETQSTKPAQSPATEAVIKQNRGGHSEAFSLDNRDIALDENVADKHLRVVLFPLVFLNAVCLTGVGTIAVMKLWI